LLASPKRELAAPLSTPSRASKRGTAASAAAKKEEAAAGEAAGMVTYKGAILDINSVMARLEKSEKTKRDTEAKLKETQEDMGMFLDFLEGELFNAYLILLHSSTLHCISIDDSEPAMKITCPL
jgi:hypothetical protein